MSDYLKLVNPTVVLHEGEIDHPEDDFAEILVHKAAIAIIRKHPVQRSMVFYVNDDRFNCFVSNPDQYESLCNFY